MYLSQTSLVLVMLLLLTSVIVYQSIDMHRKIVLNEMTASDISLKGESVEHIVISAIPKVFNKALQDAELKVINNGSFFSSPEEAKSWIENRTEEIINEYLANVSRKYNNMGYNFTYNNITINITGMPDGFTFTINYTFNYSIKKQSYNTEIMKSRVIKNAINVTVKSVVDAYEWYKTGKLYYISPEYFVEDANSPSILDRLANLSTKNWANGVGIKLNIEKQP